MASFATFTQELSNLPQWRQSGGAINLISPISLRILILFTSRLGAFYEPYYENMISRLPVLASDRSSLIRHFSRIAFACATVQYE